MTMLTRRSLQLSAAGFFSQERNTHRQNRERCGLLSSIVNVNDCYDPATKAFVLTM